MAAPTNGPIILYDGICGLCNRLVQFVLERDRYNVFRFASLQSGFATRLLAKYQMTPDSLDTMYVVFHHGAPAEQLLCRADAALAVLRRLGGVWRGFAGVGRVLPLTVRNFLYNRVARNRYRIFGKYDACPLPAPDQRAKFLDQ